jgi:hypothetical protein
MTAKVPKMTKGRLLIRLRRRAFRAPVAPRY